MSLNLYFSPFSLKFSVSANEKGAALDSKNFSAIHIFLFDHIEQVARLFVGIREQIKWKPEFVSEFFMRRYCVPGQAKYERIASLEFEVVFLKVTAFIGASGRIISRVKIEHDIFTTQ